MSVLEIEISYQNVLAFLELIKEEEKRRITEAYVGDK